MIEEVKIFSVTSRETGREFLVVIPNSEASIETAIEQIAKTVKDKDLWGQLNSVITSTNRVYIACIE